MAPNAVAGPDNMKRSMENRIIAFAATRKPAAALDFYNGLLGLRLIEENPFALVFDGGGTMVRIQIVEKLTPASHTVLGWSVDNIEKAIQHLSERGIKMERFEGMGQDRFGVWQSLAGAKVAWFKDPDANTLSLTEF